MNNSASRPIIGCMARPFVARGASFEDALECIARAGYRYLHFGPNDRKADGTPSVPEDATAEQLATLSELCARQGLVPTSMRASPGHHR